jgi:hypothetical protein
MPSVMQVRFRLTGERIRIAALPDVMLNLRPAGVRGGIRDEHPD